MPKKRPNRIGNKYPQGPYGDVVILQDRPMAKYQVKFVETGYTVEALWGDVRRGTLKDYLQPSVQGIGYLGARGLVIKNPDEYRRWTHVLLSAQEGGKSVEEYLLSFERFLSWDNAHHKEGRVLYDISGDNETISRGTLHFIPSKLCLYLASTFNPTHGKNEEGEFYFKLSYGDTTHTRTCTSAKIAQSLSQLNTGLRWLSLYMRYGEQVPNRVSHYLYTEAESRMTTGIATSSMNWWTHHLEVCKELDTNWIIRQSDLPKHQ